MRITIENNLLSIDNFNQIIDMKNDLIIIDDIQISANNIKVLFTTCHKIVISCDLNYIKMGD